MTRKKAASHDFAQGVFQGLSRPRKTLSPKYLYDRQGSELFERICECAEYYVTRTELGILKRNAQDIAALLGENCTVLELGSGASRKTRILLDSLIQPAAYVPIDISREMLLEAARKLHQSYPALPVIPVCADFTRPIELPREVLPKDTQKRVAFFPGSTIGNFEPDEARALLEHTARLLGYGGRLLIGFDLLKPREILEPAYDDAQGVTAAFNLNLLHRMKRELDADVDPAGFKHQAVFNERKGRVEMHLVSLKKQVLRIRDRSFSFEPGETIHTECSHKYTLSQFEELARQAGYRKRAFWTDERDFFCVALFEAEPVSLENAA